MKKTATNPEHSPANAPSPASITLGRDLPNLYADNLAGLSIGPYVCKITLATESIPGQLAPSLQITLPTNVMHGLAKAIMDIFSDPDTQRQLSTTFTENLAAMKTVA
jgi:hypothetical protein